MLPIFTLGYIDNALFIMVTPKVELSKDLLVTTLSQEADESTIATTPVEVESLEQASLQLLFREKRQ